MYKNLNKDVIYTSIQDLNPRPCDDNPHTPVLSFEMTTIEHGDNEVPTR